VEQLVVIEDDETSLADLEKFLGDYPYDGFPVVRRKELVGFATRDKLKQTINSLLFEDTVEGTRKCSFSSRRAVMEMNQVDLSGCLEETVLHLRKEVPLELVVSMFQRLNLRRILFTHGGKLTGMATKTDVVGLLISHFPYAGGLSNSPPTSADAWGTRS